MCFLVNTIYPTTVNLISPTIHIIPTTISQDQIISTTIISILQYCYYHVIHCNYIVTIIISIIYSYIYRYNLSIKTYNSQYRYKNIYSIIRMIINNTDMYIYTVYTYHNYAIINAILVYSNFFSAYHSYLPLKQ